MNYLSRLSFRFKANIHFVYTDPCSIISMLNDYIVYDGTIFCFVYSVHVIYKLRTCLRASSCNFVNFSLLQITPL